ncbi:MAG TPA: tripartite tricarboxylate transporter substrate binding protein [Burkholderiales bacterium]|nr:tripartite tricarboxylate transporter substrate binding protein [Burkholderiales bacterium]
MNSSLRLRLRPALTAAIFWCCMPAAFAQGAYPTHPVKLIVPYAAGSAGDVLGRIIANQLGEQLGKGVVVDNRGGAGGTIGTAEVAHAQPDGYTLGLGSQGTLINNQVLYAKPGYDSLKDYTHIAEVAAVQNVLVVAPASKYNSVSELLADIRAKPAESFKYSSSGVGTSHHMAGAVLSQFLDKPLLHVPYTGAPQGLSAIVGGDVDMGLYNIPAAIGLLRGAKLKPLAVTGLTRSALLPNIPTLDESGLKGYEVTLWFGVMAPAGLPPELLARLHAELGKVMSKPEVRARMTEQGYTVAPVPLGSPAEYTKLVARDLDKWPPIIRKLGAAAAN